jgi:site-specific recombinase XerC
LHSSTAEAISAWQVRRDEYWGENSNGSFFVGHSGTALKTRNVEWVFDGLRQSLKWKARGAHPMPRIHDLRHTFAVRRVQLWHEENVPIEQAMFWLCTYLGHAKISDTYWYLTGVPELMAIAGQHFEQFVNDSNMAVGT